MAVASLVISILALLVAGAAVWYSHRQVVAAEKSAEADQRSADLAEAEAAKYSPPWVLRWEAGDSYVLINGGDEPTLTVEIDLGDIEIVDGQLEQDRIGPGSAVKFMALRTAGTINDTVTVRWRRTPNGSLLDWQHPLPAKPRR